MTTTGALFFLAIATSLYPDSYKILTVSDQHIETEAQKVATFSSGYQPLLQWQSFSEWHCFPSQIAAIALERINDEELPYIEIKTNRRHYIFGLTPGMEIKTHEAYEKWKIIQKDSADLCIFAAKLPETWHNSKAELWYVDRVKSRAGEWMLEN